MENVSTNDKGYDLAEDILSEDEAAKLSRIQNEMTESYLKSREKMTVDEWLRSEMKVQLPDRSEQEVSDMADEIIDTLKKTEASKKSLEEARNDGMSRESWLSKTILQGTSHMSAQESAKYLQSLDDAVKAANESMYDTITTKCGFVNQNMNLDGFIAEQQHVNSFNLNAAVKGSDLHAEVLKPKPGEIYGKNTVDVVIKNADGKIVNRYQMKYGATAKDTIKMIENGDYRGQQIVVPADQVEEVQKAFPNRKVTSTISNGKVSSKSLTKEDVKNQQEEAQKGKSFLERDWSSFSNKDIALGIGKQVGVASLQGAAIGAGINLAEKIVKKEKFDAKDVAVTAAKSGVDFGVKTAAAGALKVATEKEIIKAIPKGTPASTLTSIAFVAVENAKIVGKIVKGEYTISEGLEKMQDTTYSCVGGIVASVKGAALGAKIGTVLGPVGTAVGGFVGGIAGHICGSKVGKEVSSAITKVRNFARGKLEKVANKIAQKMSPKLKAKA